MSAALHGSGQAARRAGRKPAVCGFPEQRTRLSLLPRQPVPSGAPELAWALQAARRRCLGPCARLGLCSGPAHPWRQLHRGLQVRVRPGHPQPTLSPASHALPGPQLSLAVGLGLQWLCHAQSPSFSPAPSEALCGRTRDLLRLTQEDPRRRKLSCSSILGRTSASFLKGKSTL